MQHTFEAALSLLESQGADYPVDTDVSDNEHDENPENVPQKKFKPASSKRQQLSDVEAAEIFKLRPKQSKGSGLRRGSMLLCKKIAPMYGVSPKTIRDVWRGRTWFHATEHLWTQEELREKTDKTSSGAHKMQPCHASQHSETQQPLPSFPGQSSVVPANCADFLQNQFPSFAVPNLNLAMQTVSWQQSLFRNSPAAFPSPPWSGCAAAAAPSAMDLALLRLLAGATSQCCAPDGLGGLSPLQRHAHAAGRPLPSLGGMGRPMPAMMLPRLLPR
jgi:hypothetical protein